MGNLTGGGDIIINTSSLTNYVTSVSLATAIADFITSASASTMVASQTANFITSASASTMVASQVSQAVSAQVPTVQTVTPAEGASTTVNSGTDIFYISAAALASVTIVLATTGVVTNQQLRIATLDAITSIAMSGATVNTPVATLAAGGGCLFLYDGTNWKRIG